MEFIWPEMLEKSLFSYSKTFAIPIVKIEKDKETWALGSSLRTCRDILVEELYAIQNKNYPWATRKINKKNGFSLLENKTSLFVLDSTFKNLESKIKKLHDFEKYMDLELTTFKTVSLESKVNKVIHTGIIFLSDPIWKTNLWKFSIYSYLIKKMIYDTSEYDNHLKPVFFKFMDKLKTSFEEIFNNNSENPRYAYSSVGFVTIATGYNKPMENLLLKDKNGKN